MRPTLRGAGVWLAVSVVVGTGVLLAGPSGAAPAVARPVAGPVGVRETSPAPALPRIAGVDGADPSPDEPPSVPAAGSATTGVWTVWTGLGNRSTATRMTMPAATGRALLGDWNGDGLATPGRYDAGQWFVTNAAVSTADWEPYASFGGDPADVPVTGRIDNDRRTDIGVFRNGTWLWLRANGKPARTDEFGAAGDTPIVGDWDGDGRDDIGVVRGGAWILRVTGTAKKPSWVGKGVQVQRHPESDAVVVMFPYGLPTDVPVVGDWDGDGRDDPGVVRSGRDWYLSKGLGRVLKTTHEVHGVTGDEVPLVGGQATAPGHCPTATRAGERYGVRLADYVRPAIVPRGRVGMAGGSDILATIQDGLRYAVTDALTSRLAGRTGRPYYDPLSTDSSTEEAIRRSANATLAAAIMLRTTDWQTVNGVSRKQLLDFARWNIRSLACQHGASSPGGWGNDWQSALWATTTGQAGWLLWPYLNREERGLVAAMVVSEAEYASARGPRYWTNRLGEETKPGDSQSDAVSWDLTAPALALAMMPKYGSAGKWRSALVAMSIAAFARPSDIHQEQTVNGVRVDIRIPGTNANEDGTVTNHGIVNPDYTQNVEHLWWAATMLRSGGRPVPEALFFNADIVYRALSQVQFTSPPYAEPGGTVYQPDGRIYYPMGVSWGNRRPATFVGVDAFANLYASDGVQVKKFLAAHAADTRAMQRRYTTGKIYSDGWGEDSYKLGREEYALQQMALAWWAGAWKDGPAMRVDRTSYRTSLGVGKDLP